MHSFSLKMRLKTSLIGQKLGIIVCPNKDIFGVQLKTIMQADTQKLLCSFWE